MHPGSSSFIDMESLTAHVRTRLYFTSESHVHSLINSLRLWSKEDVRRHPTPAPAFLSLHLPTTPCLEPCPCC